MLNIVLAGPYDMREIDWDRDKQAYGERQLELLSEKAIPGLADHVQVMDVSTPKDFERRLLTPEGAILGLDMDLPVLHRVQARGQVQEHQGPLSRRSLHPSGWRSAVRRYRRASSPPTWLDI